MQFLMLFYADEEAWTALPAAERDAATERIGAWFGEQAQSGRIVGGHRLSGSRTTAHVRLGPAGRSAKPLVTDGPFIETKEAIGSYAVFDAPDRDAALAVAASWPAGGVVELHLLTE
jgi:hypothetical protein